MRRLLLLTAAGLVVSSAAMAADITDIRFAMHRKGQFIVSKAIPNLCDNAGTPTAEPNYSPNYDNIPCTDYTLTGPLAGSQIYVVIARDQDGVSGASFGVDYNGRPEPGVPANGIDPDFASWTLCSDGLSFPNDGGFGEFPKPKGGIRLTWNTCATQTVAGKVHAVTGTFYIYAYAEDVMRLTPNNNLLSGPELAVTNCGGQETKLTDFLSPTLIDAVLGRVHIGGDGSQGYTPCGVVPIEPTTWGKVKTLYSK